jgi:hypothetical protein
MDSKQRQRCEMCSRAMSCPIVMLATKCQERFVEACAPLTQQWKHEFNAEQYLRANPNVAAAGHEAATHYLEFGRSERRCLPPLNHTGRSKQQLIELAFFHRTRSYDRRMHGPRALMHS